MLGILLNSCPNPLVNPKSKDKSKLVEIALSGTEGISKSPAPNPNTVNITPISAVMINPTNTEAGTCLIYRTKVMMMPINARSAWGAISDPIVTKLEGLGTIIPAPLNLKMPGKIQ